MACTLGDLPPEDGPAPEVRASLIRLLAMGGTEACGLHGSGVVLIGARIPGRLDLRFAKCRGRLALVNCQYAAEPRFDQAEVG